MIAYKPVNGYPNYLVGDDGSVYSLYTHKFLKQHKCTKGYLFAILHNGGSERRIRTHRLVASAFLNKPDGGKYEVNHKNLDKTDNRASNLEWVSHAENVRHASRAGAMGTWGSKNHRSVINESIAIEMKARSTNERVCDLAREYGVSTTVVSKLKHGVTWKRAVA